MGNTAAHAQEVQAPAKYGPGVKVTDRSGGDGDSVNKTHRYVKLKFDGLLAGNAMAKGVGWLDLHMVRENFKVAYKNIPDAPIDAKADTDLTHGEGVLAQRWSGTRPKTKLEESQAYGQAFAPMGTAILKCMERSIVGGYGEPGYPEPMKIGEKYKLQCTKDIAIQANMYAADIHLPQSRGLLNQRTSTAGVARFTITVKEVSVDKPTKQTGADAPQQTGFAQDMPQRL